MKMLCGCGSGREAVTEDEHCDGVTSDEQRAACKGSTGVAASKVRVSHEPN